MPRIPPVTPNATPAASEPMLDAIKARLGDVPNLMRTLAHAPAVLRGYLGFAQTLAGGSLSARERELLALAVGQANQCDYCVAAHVAGAANAGISDAEVAAARRGEASDMRENALLQLALAVARERGRVGDATLALARSRGLNDTLLIEVVAQVALNVFTNSLNHLAQTEIDFAPAPAL